MDYSLFTEKNLTNRYDELPEHIQDLLSNEHTDKVVMQIGKSHYLNLEKIELLKQLVGFVLLGFLDMRDLRQELIERVYMNFEHATALSDDLGNEIFNEIKGDLAQIYMPIEEELAMQQGEAHITSPRIEVMEKEPEEIQASVPIIGGKTSATKNDSDAPLILQETKPVSVEAGERGKMPFKDFSKSFSFFSKRTPSDEAQNSPIKAKIEAPKGERVVHYSELNSPSSGLSHGGGGFINLETFGEVSKLETVSELKEIPKPSGKVPMQEPTSESPIEELTSDIPDLHKKPTSPKTQEQGTMKKVVLEGNTINLRN